MSQENVEILRQLWTDQLTRRLDGVADGSPARKYGEVAGAAIARVEANG